jgi:hypothetical protein
VHKKTDMLMLHGFSLLRCFPARIALQVVQQMQQQQNAQMNMMMTLVQQVQGQAVPGVPPAGSPPGDTPAPTSEGDAGTYHGSDQGVRMCSRCGKVAYLREGVCFNLECEPWLH